VPRRLQSLFLNTLEIIITFIRRKQNLDGNKGHLAFLGLLHRLRINLGITNNNTPASEHDNKKTRVGNFAGCFQN
jgi:hypothetical protein